MSRIFLLKVCFAAALLLTPIASAVIGDSDAAMGASIAASTKRKTSDFRSDEGGDVSFAASPNVRTVLPAVVPTVDRDNSDDSSDDDNDDVITDSRERAVLVQRAFKEVLKLSGLPEVGRGAGAGLQPAETPAYMIELYERYRRGEISKRGGNTVRSIVSLKGNINGEEMLLFNLSGIGRREELMHAELHFYKRRKVKFFNRGRSSSDFRLKFVGISSDENRVTPLSLIDLPSHHRGRGWQVQDVTRVVDACRAASRWHAHHLLGVRMQGLSRKSKYISLPFNKFLRHNSQPFLVVFSNDSDNDTIDKLEAEHATSVITEAAAILDDVTVTPEKVDYQNTNYDVVTRTRTRNSNGTSAPSEEPDTSLLKRLSRRSIEDNELPDNSVYANYVPKTSPGVLQSRGRHRSKSAESKTIPYPAAMTFGKNRKKVQEQNRQRQNRKLPSAWHDKAPPDLLPLPVRHENDATSDAVGEENNNSCRKQKLVVDFADIGWGEWIISPKSFEAHYCSGVCPFPLTKNLKPSNHATIQSIVHAIGIQTHVPCPVCVADVLSSVTLLYFDEDRNVVLKNYPGMTVESCACR